MNVVRQVLSIDVVLTGAERLDAWLGGLGDRMANVSSTSLLLSAGLLAVAGATRELYLGFQQAVATDKMRGSLMGLVRDAEVVSNQIELINSIAAKGIFKRDDVFGAVEQMDRTNVQMSKYVGLVEALGARKGNIKEAAEFMSWFKGAPDNVANWLLYMRLEKLGITAQMMKPYGVGANTQGIVQKAAVEKALFDMASKDGSMVGRADTFEAQVNRMTFAWDRFREASVQPILGPLSAVLSVGEAIARTFQRINEATGGLAGYLSMGGVIIMGLTTAAFLVQQTAIWQAAASGYAWLQSVATGLTVTNMRAQAVALLMTLPRLISAAWFSATIAAAFGNYIPLGMMIAGGIAIAVGTGVAVRNHYANQDNKGIDKPNSDRPIRHDDVENVWNRWQGKVWA